MRTPKEKIAAIILAALVGGPFAWTTTSRGFDEQTAEHSNSKSPAPVVVNPEPLSRETKMTTSFAPVVKKATPSVVNIFSTKTVKNPYGQLRPFFDFRRFFGEQ